MMERICRMLDRISSLPVVALLFTLTIVLTILFRVDVPGSMAPWVQKLGVKILDARFYYSPEDVRTLWNALGADGRKAYMLMHATLDLAYPAVYSLFLATAATLALRRTAWSRWSLVPLLTGILDWLENGTIMLLMWRGVSPTLAGVAGGFTMVKWTWGGVSVLVLLAGTLQRLLRGPSQTDRPSKGPAR